MRGCRYWTARFGVVLFRQMVEAQYYDRLCRNHLFLVLVRLPVLVPLRFIRLVSFRLRTLEMKIEEQFFDHLDRNHLFLVLIR